MLVAINTHVINKSKDFVSLAYDFENVELDQSQLAAAINRGYAFTTQHTGGADCQAGEVDNHQCLTKETNHRQQNNFTGAGYIALDFDHVTPEQEKEILERYFTNQYASIIYHTSSSTSANPRFRVLFELETPIFDSAEYKKAVQALMWHYELQSDTYCKDPCRLFYGAKGSNPKVTLKTLPDRVLEEIITEWDLEVGSILEAAPKKIPAKIDRYAAATQEELNEASLAANAFLKACRLLNWQGYEQWQKMAVRAISLDRAFSNPGEMFYDAFVHASRQHPQYTKADEYKLEKHFKKLQGVSLGFEGLGLEYDQQSKQAVDPRLPGFRPMLVKQPNWIEQRYKKVSGGSPVVAQITRFGETKQNASTTAEDYERDGGLPEEDNPKGKFSKSDSNTKGGKGKSQATLLAELAEGEYFHDEKHKAYVTLAIEDHFETWAVRSREFKLTLVNRFYNEHSAVPGAQAIEDALKLLEAKALFESERYPVFLRVGNKDENIYLDLGDDTWQSVKITRKGWEIISEPEVKFKRSKGMAPIPMPVRGGNLADLMEIVNLDAADWILLGGWIVAATRVSGPFPILGLQGEQGSAKSTFTKIIKSLIDPSTPAIRTAPRDEQDLAIAAANSWVLAYDNLSGMPNWLSDSLCRVSTGGGLATRELYSDDSESIFDFTRPVILNGIESVASRSDLLDRTILLELPTIREDRRKTEREVLEQFEAKRPELLGALLDVISLALRRYKSVKLDNLPRMADFAIWAVAAEPGFRTDNDRDFMEAYTEKREDSNALALEHSMLGDAVIKWFEGYKSLGSWSGTSTELLKELNHYMVTSLEKFDPSRVKNWPQDATRLSGALKRLAPNFRAAGIDFSTYREYGGNRAKKILLQAI